MTTRGEAVSGEDVWMVALANGPDDVRSIRVILATGLRILRPNGLMLRSFGSTTFGRRISFACDGRAGGGGAAETEETGSRCLLEFC